MPRSEARHPIGIVSERTGLTADVLRAWERRYQVVEPLRSSGGQRLYSDADIERLALLHRATQRGHGISHVARLDAQKLEDLARELEASAPALPVQFSGSAEPRADVGEAISFTEDLDPVGLEALFRRSVSRYGLVNFLDAVAAPFLRQVGEDWHDEKLTVAQEHLATAVVQRVVGEMAPVMSGGEGKPTIVVGTLEGERHANGALMAAATAAGEGWRVLYLGADLPAEDIADAAGRTKARAVGISVVLSKKKKRMAADLRELEKALPAQSVLLVGGVGARRLKDLVGKSRIVFIDSMSELRKELKELGAQ